MFGFFRFARDSFIIKVRFKSFSTIMSDINTVGVCQMRTTNDKKNNLDQVKTLVERSIGKAKILFFPECCDFVGSSVDETLQLSESLEGHTVQSYKNLAKTHKLWLSFGGFHEIIPANNGTQFVHNTHILINSDGEIVDLYRKLHLFDVQTPDFKFRESKLVKPGNSVGPPVNTPIGKIGLQICYDIRFAESSLLLAQQGAQVLTYPSAFAFSTGTAHWEVLNRCRAIENQCFVISAAQIGSHNQKRKSYGHAMIVNPFGKILAECTEELEVQFAEIDLDSIEKVRKNMPCSEHRRRDIYTLKLNPDSPAIEDTREFFMFENHKIDARTVFYQTKHCIAFTNIRCVVPGHVLVSTKRIAPRVEAMLEDEARDFFETVCKVQKALEKHYELKSTTLNIQDGEDAGQTVRHVHCHVLPRRKGDFGDNEIYTELSKHDTENTLLPRRDLQTMIDEATLFKQYFSTPNPK